MLPVMYDEASAGEQPIIAIEAAATIFPLASKNNKDSKNQFSATITYFKINLKNIELGVEGTSTYADFILNGPFELDLSSGNTIVDISTITLPNGTYDKIRFDLHKSLDNQSDLYEKSIEVTGEINGTPYIFWHNTEEIIEVDFNNTINLVVNGDENTAVIDFNLNSLIETVVALDYSGITLEDTNSNGIIEIDPANTDGNGNIAELFISAIQEGVVLN